MCSAAFGRSTRRYRRCPLHRRCPVVHVLTSERSPEIGSPSSITCTAPGRAGEPSTRNTRRAWKRSSTRESPSAPPHRRDSQTASVGELVQVEIDRWRRACRSRNWPGLGRAHPALGAGRAEVGLGRAQVAVGDLDVALGLCRVSELRAAGLGEQGSDRRLRLVVVALAEMDVADLALRVDQVLRRPVLVPERGPGAELVVLDDRVARSRSRRSRRRRCRRPFRTGTPAHGRRRW